MKETPMLREHPERTGGSKLTSKSRQLSKSRGCRYGLVLFCAAFVLSGPPFAAAGENPTINVYGAGASSCSNWLSERKNIAAGESPTPLAFEQMGWVLGYATAFSQHVPRSAEAAILPNGGILAQMVDDYCIQRPSDLLAAATSGIMQYAAQAAVQTAGARSAATDIGH
jgi:hypothetical protein